MGLIPFTDTANAVPVGVQERQVPGEGNAAARSGLVTSRAALVNIKLFREILDGRALEKMYKGVDICLRAENQTQKHAAVNVPKRMCITGET